MTTAGSDQDTAAAIARSFLDGLLRAVATLRQHGPLHAIARATLAQFETRWARLQLDHVVEIDLQASVAHCGGEAVFDDARGELLPALLALGVGRLLLLPDMAAAALRQLAIGLALGSDAAGGDLVAQLRLGDRLGPRLLPARLATATTDAAVTALELLPAPCRPSAGGRAACAREQALNLAVHAARLLLQDLDRLPSAAPLLQRVVHAIAARGDLAGCALVLEHCRHHGSLPAASRQDIDTAARQLFANRLQPAGLRQMTEDQLLTLTGLSLQLGDDAVAELLVATQSAGVSLPAWLRDAVRPTPPPP